MGFRAKQATGNGGDGRMDRKPEKVQIGGVQWSLKGKVQTGNLNHLNI